jgi:hypothetical protein
MKHTLLLRTSRPKKLKSLQSCANFITLSSVSTNFLRALLLSRSESAEIFSHISKLLSCVELAHTKFATNVLVSTVFSLCRSEIHMVTTGPHNLSDKQRGSESVSGVSSQHKQPDRK